MTFPAPGHPLPSARKACAKGPGILTVARITPFWSSPASSAAPVAETFHPLADFLDHGCLFRIVELAVPIGINIVETTGEGTGNFLLGKEAIPIRIPFLHARADLLRDAGESFSPLLRLSCFPSLLPFLGAPGQRNRRIQFDDGLGGYRRILSLGNIRTWRRDGSF